MGITDYDLVVVGGGPAGAAAAKAAADGGLKTLIIERKEIPRHKTCDGMIMPAAEQYIEKYFGLIPDEVLAEPKVWKGAQMHLSGSGAICVKQPFKNSWRKKLDSWLCSASGAEIWDQTRVTDFAEWNDHVDIVCVRGEDEIRLRAPAMVAADGACSKLVEKIDPTVYDIDWKGGGILYCHQDYRKGSIDLDPSYYHTFLTRGIGLQATLYFKDDLIVTDSIVFASEKVKPVREKLTSFLAENHGFKPGETVFSLGCLSNCNSIINRFCFGTARVLVAGHAAGFANMFSEGISSAVATGYLAGQAVAKSEGKAPGPVYREDVKPERERSAGDWYIPWLMRGKAAPFIKEAFMAAPLRAKIKATRDLMGYQKSLGWKYSYMFEIVMRKLIYGDFNFRA